MDKIKTGRNAEKAYKTYLKPLLDSCIERSLENFIACPSTNIEKLTGIKQEIEFINQLIGIVQSDIYEGKQAEKELENEN